MSQKINYNGRVLVLGCGGVAQCLLPVLLRHLEMPADRITVIDMVDNRSLIKSVLDQGVHYVQERITPDHYDEQFARFLKPGDMLIDLAWNLGCIDLLEWCHDHEVLYINTSTELWEPFSNVDSQHTIDRTLYVRYMAIRKLVAGWQNQMGTTAVIEHGANPGLVSHFTKQALIDISRKILYDKPRDPRVPALNQALEASRFDQLAYLTGVKVIHISERDTQITRQPRRVNEFVNTWSVEGFYEEGIAPAEMGWGTHEQSLPRGARLHHSGPRNQICLTRYGMNTWVRSWVPSGEILGMVIRHGEAFSISDFLTLNDDQDHVIYRPTVHYAYCPCDGAIASLHELRMRNYQLQQKWRILKDDIISGKDELGCLLMGHDYTAWWTGSLLDIEEARRIIPGQNATTLQVAASMMGAIVWMIKNPRQGVCMPEALPHEEIMTLARQYLGPYVSQSVDWMPGMQKDISATLYPDYPLSDTDPWQFNRFLVV